jgi:putative phosphoserine phosphatase/1-acylglycerol-3-phosphate O-acyltransferase
MHVLRVLAGVILFLALASAVLLLLAVTWSPGFVMRTMAPRFGRWLCAVAGIRLVVEGREHLAQPAVIVANHRSALEAIIIPAVLPPKVRYVGKKEVARVPIFGWVLRATGQILIDRSDPEAAIASIEASLASMPRGLSVFIFPEGTRSDGALGPFKKGAFHIAMRLGVPMVPMAIEGAQLLLPRHALLPRPGTVTIKISPPVDTSAWSPATLDRHVMEVREAMLRQLEQLRAEPLDTAR